MSVIVPALTDTELRKFAAAIQQLAQGRSNSIGTFTLTANATSTTVAAPTCSAGSFVLIVPTTQHAANDGATTSIVAGSGQFVVTHANNSRNDRTFGFLVVG